MFDWIFASSANLVITCFRHISVLFYESCRICNISPAWNSWIASCHGPLRASGVRTVQGAWPYRVHVRMRPRLSMKKSPAWYRGPLQYVLTIRHTCPTLQRLIFVVCLLCFTPPPPSPPAGWHVAQPFLTKRQIFYWQTSRRFLKLPNVRNVEL